MISALLTLGAHAIAVSALTVGKPGCELHFEMNGAVASPVGQFADGGVGAGAGIESAAFELREKQLFDSRGRGCWWSRVLQCSDENKPDSGFAVNCDNVVGYNKQAFFYKCGSETPDQHSISLEPKSVNCSPVSLKADACAPGDCSAPASTAAALPTPTSLTACPADLGASFEFPHLIVPVDKAKPGEAAGTSYFGQATSTISSLFNFDFPASDRGKTCTMVFLYPNPQRPDTSTSTTDGTAELYFKKLRWPASEDSTYQTKPAEERALKGIAAVLGNNYTIDSFSCPAGGRLTIEMLGGEHTNLKYFQDYNPPAIGLYMTKC